MLENINKIKSLKPSKGKFLVYRLEDERGNGIYTVDPPTDVRRLAEQKYGYRGWADSYMDLIEAHDASYLTRHHLPSTDAQLSRYTCNREHSFGFANFAQYFNWFYMQEWRNKLTEFGVLLNVYEVSERDLCIGDYQVTFDKRKAKMIVSLPPCFVD